MNRKSKRTALNSHFNQFNASLLNECIILKSKKKKNLNIIPLPRPVNIQYGDNQNNF